MKNIYQNITRKLVFRRRDAYRRMFLDIYGNPNADAEVVLADLKRFCCGSKSTIRMNSHNEIDPIAMGVAEGRREVWMRLMEYLHLEEKTVTNLMETIGDDQ